MEISASLLIALLLGLSALHFYWALGGRAGFESAVPTVGEEPLFVPGPAACAGVGVALLAAALVSALRVDLVSVGLPAWIPRAGVWALVIAFGARAVGDFRYVGFFKKVKDTTFARQDSRYYSPLCALISSLAWVVA